MTDEDRAVAAEAGGEAIEERSREGAPYRCRLVAHDEAAYDWYYNVISNPTLWFLQHYLWDLAHEPSHDPGLHHAWEEGYVAGERRLRRRRAGRARGASPTARSSSTTTTCTSRRASCASAGRDRARPLRPHPVAAARLLARAAGPIRRAIHDGLLACDLVGFHTRRWRRNFLRSCVDLLGADCDFEEGTVAYDGRRTAWPHGRSRSTRPSSTSWPSARPSCALERRLAATRPEFLVLRVDRTDPSKNVVRGFRAFELFLDAHPELHGRVSMLALLDPSRQDIPEYAEYLGAIQRAARRVNDRFQQDGWIPIDLRIEDNFAETVAAYKQFDVLLVNAIFDGLNLVAKEAPLVNERDGVLVLSENAGSHEELGEWALTVNPFDVEGQAEAIHDGATMPREERRARLDAIRGHVRGHDVADWLAGQLADLDRLVRGRRGADGRALARRRQRARPDGGRRRQAAVAAPGAGARRGADGVRRRRAGCASCRRATRSRRRSSPGSWPPSGRAS